MRWDDFKRWFNRDFWKAFKKRTFPIVIPKTSKEKESKVREVFEAVRLVRYAPSTPEAEIVMNKGFGVARTVPVFCIEDYIVYYFCIRELEDVIAGNRTANTFGGWTLGGKLRQQEYGEIESDTGFSSARYAFDPRAWTAAFGEFNALLFAQLESGDYTHVLQFDLANFYDCVRLDILERWIREDADRSKGWIIALLFYFLNQWNRRNTGLHPQGVGIPQDALADCSRLLANYYLQKYDKFVAALCSKHGASFFRYADDQMILLKGTEHVEALMLLITRNLDRYGLRVNQKKVDIWTVQKLIEYRCRDIHSIFANKGDNQNPALVRRFADAYLNLSKEELQGTWNGGLPLLNRLLWSNLESLPKTQFETLLLCFTEPAYLLRAEREKIVRVHHLNSKRSKPVNLAHRLKELAEKNLHNAFHHEAIGYARELRNRELENFLVERLKAIESEIESFRMSFASTL